MGRKSTKENKNIYQLSREDAGLTREDAAEALVFISDDRIEKIENKHAFPHPDEVMAMAECYKNPALVNYFCTHECPIGQKYYPELELKGLGQITLELLNSLNYLEKQKDRLIEIAVDGKINPSEVEDFKKISQELRNISKSAQTMQLFIEQQKQEGKLS